MSLQGLKVLVIEDEALVSMMVEDFLDELGCEVAGTASRLEEALHKAATLTFDVAILDVNLAGVMSYPVADLLRERKIPFLFATGYGVDGLPGELDEAGVLSKPYQIEALETALLAATGG